MPRMPTFEVDVLMATDKDHQQELVKNWCELVLIIKQNSQKGENAVVELTRKAGEEIIEKLHGGLHPHAGNSILQTLWGELEELTRKLLDKTAELPDDRIRAQVTAQTIARLINPYKCDEDAVKKQVMRQIRIKDDDRAKKKLGV